MANHDFPPQAQVLAWILILFNKWQPRFIGLNRLIEVMMKKVLQIALDHVSICGIEHHMDNNFSNALCTLLNHPRKCPHGDPIPRGDCCLNK